MHTDLRTYEEVVRPRIPGTAATMVFRSAKRAESMAEMS